MLCATVYCIFAFALTAQGATFCICPDGSVALEAACQPSDCCAEEAGESDVELGHTAHEISESADAHACINIVIPQSGTDGSALAAAEFRGSNVKPLDSIVIALHYAERAPGNPDTGVTASSYSPALTASATPAESMPPILRL